MFGRATIRLGIGPHSSYFSLTVIITLCVSRRRRQMFCGHPRLCVGLFFGRMPTLLHEPGYKLGEW